MAVELSVVIPCYGHAVELDICLRALTSQRTNIGYEVIVVDSSSDTSIEKIYGLFPQVQLIRSQTRLFPGGARNLGAKQASGRVIAFLDADCIPTPDWVETAYRSIQSERVIASGPVIDVKPVHFIAWVDNRCQFADFQSGRPAGELTYAPGCNLIVPKDIWNQLNGFREDMVTGEDGFFSMDVTQKNFKITFNPSLIVQHHGRRDWRGFLEHQESLGYNKGAHALFVTDSLVMIGRSPWLAWMMIPRRFAYFLLRTIQYDRPRILRFLFSIPLFLVGLSAWTHGFYLGIKIKKAGV